MSQCRLDDCLALRKSRAIRFGPEVPALQFSNGDVARRVTGFNPHEAWRAISLLSVQCNPRAGANRTKILRNLTAQLESEKINFRSLTDGIDTTTTAGRFFFHVMASLAQMERELTLERTKAGLLSARKLGRIGGRRRTMTDSKIKSAQKLLANGMPPKEVARDLGVSIPTLYRWIPAAASSYS